MTLDKVEYTTREEHFLIIKCIIIIYKISEKNPMHTLYNVKSLDSLYKILHTIRINTIPLKLLSHNNLKNGYIEEIPICKILLRNIFYSSINDM